MTIDDIIAGVIQREGGYSHDLKDPGGETNYGITWPTLKRAIVEQLVPPTTTIKSLTPALATTIYHHLFVLNPGFDQIPFEDLKAEMVDFGVNSGPARATRTLQRLLHLEPTGVLDGTLVSTIWKHDPLLLNDALAGARAKFIDELTDAKPEMKKFEEGLESRALDFVESVPSLKDV